MHLWNLLSTNAMPAAPACHVESQGLSDAAGGSGDHRDLSFNRVHIDGAAGRHLKSANFLCVEAPVLDGSSDNAVDKSL